MILDLFGTFCHLLRYDEDWSVRFLEALLTSLVRTFARWTGSSALFLELEAHGREAGDLDLDVSRTVGWFTSSFPVCLDVGNGDGPDEARQRIGEQLCAVPRRGLGYGLLRYLCPDPAVVSRLRSLPRPQVSFNYLGRFDAPEIPPAELLITLIKKILPVTCQIVAIFLKGFSFWTDLRHRQQELRVDSSEHPQHEPLFIFEETGDMGISCIHQTKTRVNPYFGEWNTRVDVLQ